MFLPKELLQVKKYNDKIERKMKDTYLWDAKSTSFFILNNMAHEAGRDDNSPGHLCYALFMAYRLKFADEKTIELAKNAILYRKKDFTASIDGEHTIFQTMRFHNCDYFEALMWQYRETKHCCESKLPYRISYHNKRQYNDSDKMHFTKLSDDNKLIIYMDKKDWEEEFGSYEVEASTLNYSEYNKILRYREENGIPYETFHKKYTDEEKLKIKEIGKLIDKNLNDEIKNWEIKFNKKSNKWNFEENKEFDKHLFMLRKEGKYI